MSSAWVSWAALGGALWLDWRFGEPPARLHPVVWMGRYLGALGPRISLWRPASAYGAGLAAWSVGAVIVVALALAADRVVALLPTPLLAVCLALLLKPLLAWRMLHDEVAAVETALAVSLAEGRNRLRRLVSRDVSALDATQVRESALESLAENLNDSVVAPLFWFALGGLAGAALYRFANTADAMWGYRGRYEWAGKWAAWVDDGLSWVPARLTALLLWAVAGQRLSFTAARREARATPSPNGGWPMGVMALLLQVRLRKPGLYALNAAGADCEAAHTGRALAWCHRVVIAMALVSGVGLLAPGLGGAGFNA